MNKKKRLLIEKYFDNKLNKKESDLFHKYMKNDSFFYDNVIYEKKIREYINKYNISDFRFKIYEIEEPKKMRNNKKVFYILPLIMLFIFSYFFIYNDKDLYKKYYDSENITRPRYSNYTISNIEDIIKYKSIYHYNRGDYYISISYFEKIIEKDNKNIAARFYLSISYMEVGNYKKALDNFRYIISDSNNLYIEKSTWYSSLCLLKLEKKDEAINYLIFISSDSNNYYYNKSKKLLREIN